jgi:hypothetical protein
MLESLKINTVISKPRLLQGLPEMDGLNEPKQGLAINGVFLLRILRGNHA